MVARHQMCGILFNVHLVTICCGCQALEDLCVHYDGTVRNADSSIMQFEYGGDGLEPASMEGTEWPVEFERVLNYVKVKVDLE